MCLDSEELFEYALALPPPTFCHATQFCEVEHWLIMYKNFML